MLYRNHIFYAHQIKPFCGFHVAYIGLCFAHSKLFLHFLGEEVAKDALRLLSIMKRALENFTEKMPSYLKAAFM